MNNPPPNTLQTYSNIVSTQKIPTRDQAIVLSTIDGTKIHDYIIAVGALVQPKNIFYASKISNGRICIYLSSKKILDELLTATNRININGSQVEVRRLISPAQRLVISNICSTIPNPIEEQLRKMGLKTSPTPELGWQRPNTVTY
ncbi:hypothetical protein JTB14_026465 [Gonioctena quinquepunctata]|nr:hypothetical protein JTB14_026465 [Gonioctena quinquepunctata]